MQRAQINTTLVTPNISVNATETTEGLLSNPIELVSFTLSILGIIANVTAIFATVKVPNYKTTHSKLIVSLCVSDGLVLIAIPLKYILDTFSDLFGDCKNLYKPILYIALIATQINLLAMALDHYIAIMRPLHHRRLMSNFRGNFIVMIIWVFSITAGLLEFIIGLLMKAESGDTKSVCTIILIDQYDLEIFIIGFIFVVLFIIVIIYTRIYMQLKSHVLVGIPRKQTSKALVTTVLLIGTFTLCWAPMGIFQIYMNFLYKTDVFYLIDHLEALLLVNRILLIILQLNSLIDPLIYAIRLPQVRTGCHAFFGSYKYETRPEISLPLSPLRDHYITEINE
ncbi:adrenocorticotropic hormone receptor-like [Mercenaria mercenaria]|uniref:adrenocorticotropic hormone receptor-like n=1 Tax=Mercenaria mercenaria TaxID=6596 RepID=UPI00234E60CB|nr:adrenocorticotropic hormone receptor-like [Mercenaria mercenaria]